MGIVRTHVLAAANIRLSLPSIQSAHLKRMDQAVGALFVVLDELAQRGKDVACRDVDPAVGLADAVMKDLALVADGDGMLARAALAFAHKKAAVDTAAEQILGRGAGDLAGKGAKKHMRLAFEIGGPLALSFLYQRVLPLSSLTLPWYQLLFSSL